MMRALSDISRPAAPPGSACLPPGRRFLGYGLVQRCESVDRSSASPVTPKRPPRQALPSFPGRVWEPS